MIEPLSIISVGMVSSVGLNAYSSSAAIRAGLDCFEEIPFYDEFGNPIIGSSVPKVITNQQGYQRIVPMICNAMMDCIFKYNNIKKRFDLGEIPITILVDELSRPDYPEKISELIIDQITKYSGLTKIKHIKIFTESKAGITTALNHVDILLNDPEVEFCILASGDSLLNGRAIKWLENNGRLKMDMNSDGVIPGEAAAALLFQRPYGPLESMLDVIGIGSGSETSIIENDKPNLAVGLADAIQNALNDSQLPLKKIDFRVGGMTGERLEFMEASTALARIQRVHKDNFELWMPAEELGDVGAALSTCMLVVTAIGMKKGYAPGDYALVFTSSNSPKRAACITSSPKRGI